MSAPIEGVNNGLWQLFCIEGQVGEWHDLIIAAVVKEYWRLAWQFRNKVIWQCDCLISLILPAITVPIRRRDEKNSSNDFFNLLFAKIFQQEGVTERMPDENHAVFQPGQLFSHSGFPILIVGIALVPHLRIEQFVGGSKSTAQRHDQLPVSLVSSRSASLNE